MIELKGDSHTCTYIFKKLNSYQITGNEETIATFKNQCAKNEKNKKTSKNNDVAAKLKSLSKTEYMMLENKLFYSFGCKIKICEDDEDETKKVIKIKGFKPDLAFNLINNHPLLKIDISMLALYPAHWTDLKELKDNEHKGYLKPVDPTGKPFLD
jgi:hypothetical protein